jgi:hypothetical protein
VRLLGPLSLAANRSHSSRRTVLLNQGWVVVIREAKTLGESARLQMGNGTPTSRETNRDCTASCLECLCFGHREIHQARMKLRDGDGSSRSPVRPVVLHAQLDVRVVHRPCSWRDGVLVIPCRPLFRRHRVVVIRSRLGRCGTLVLERKISTVPTSARGRRRLTETPSKYTLFLSMSTAFTTCTFQPPLAPLVSSKYFSAALPTMSRTLSPGRMFHRRIRFSGCTKVWDG